MKVKITCSGRIDISGSDENGFLEVEENATVKQILAQLSMDKRLRKHIPVIISSRLVKRSHRPQDGDELILVVPIAGG